MSWDEITHVINSVKFFQKLRHVPDSVPNRINVGAMSAMLKRCCTDSGRHRSDGPIWNAIWAGPVPQRLVSMSTDKRLRIIIFSREKYQNLLLSPWMDRPNFFINANQFIYDFDHILCIVASILFYSILFYSFLFYFILFYSAKKLHAIIPNGLKWPQWLDKHFKLPGNATVWLTRVNRLQNSPIGQ